jgi:hypothetical protein
MVRVDANRLGVWVQINAVAALDEHELPDAAARDALNQQLGRIRRDLNGGDIAAVFRLPR